MHTSTQKQPNQQKLSTLVEKPSKQLKNFPANKANDNIRTKIPKMQFCTLSSQTHQNF